MFISVKILPSQQVREAPSVSGSATAVVVNCVRGRKAVLWEPCPLLPFAEMRQVAIPGQSIPGWDPAETLP